MASVLKTEEPQGSVGSNPTPSANNEEGVMFKGLRQRFTAFFHPKVPAPTPTLSGAPGHVPRLIRDLSPDEQIRWAYSRFKPEVAHRVARSIRARAKEEDPRSPSVVIRCCA